MFTRGFACVSSRFSSFLLQSQEHVGREMNVFAWSMVTAMDLPCTQCPQQRLWIHHDPDQSISALSIPITADLLGFSQTTVSMV